MGALRCAAVRTALRSPTWYTARVDLWHRADGLRSTTQLCAASGPCCQRRLGCCTTRSTQWGYST
eukprot:5423802-Prymnesium_polylepis.1